MRISGRTQVLIFQPKKYTETTGQTHTFFSKTKNKTIGRKFSIRVF